jgi:hypothetical protein
VTTATISAATGVTLTALQLKPGLLASEVTVALQYAIRHAETGSELEERLATTQTLKMMTDARRTVWSSVDTLAMGAIQDPPMCV